MLAEFSHGKGGARIILAVRTGIVADPADHRWSGYAEAMAGKVRARRGLVRVTGSCAWPRETTAGARSWGIETFPAVGERRGRFFIESCWAGR